MTDREFKERLQKSVNSTLSCLEPSARQCDRIVQETLEGKKVMKKHISFALVLAILLACVTAGAGAATLLWRDYVPQMKQEEHELGDYDEWPDAQRIQLAKDILAMGYLEDSEDTRILSDETATEQEKAAAADRLMLQLTGEDDVREVHSTLITYAIMGHEDTWTPAQRAWWNGIITMYGDDGAPDTLIAPTEEDLPEEEAVRIGRAAVMEAYGFDEAYMDGLTPVTYLYVTDVRPDYRRWIIHFKQYPDGVGSYMEKEYIVVVDENGEVIADPDIAEPSIYEKAEMQRESKEEEKPQYMTVFRKYSEQNGLNPFWEWPYTEKAAYSTEIFPLTKDLESLQWEVGESTIYRYGLPQSDDMPYEDALNKAYETIEAEYGLTSDQAKCYSKIYEAFDITDENNTKWKFVLINPDDWYGLRYRVIIDSKTGDIILAEEFPWMPTFKDDEIDLKYY